MDVTSAGSLVVDVELEGDLCTLPEKDTRSAVRLPEIHHLVLRDVLAPLPRSRLLLRELRKDPRWKRQLRIHPDEPPARPPIPDGHLSSEGHLPHRDAVLKGVLGERMPARERHVVDLMPALCVPPDPELDGKVLHEARSSATRVDLLCLHSELAGHIGVHIIALVHDNVAEAVPGREELQCACISEVLAANESLLLSIRVVLDGDVHAAHRGHMLGLQRQGIAGFPVTPKLQSKLHLEALDKDREAVVALDLPPVHENLVARRQALLMQLDKPEALPPVVEVHIALVPGIGVDLEALWHRLGWLPLIWRRHN
mmetsp:Transcript_27894/g.59052  ORF Transcript_27894/g.59052 Transcript_27894/m.59052 type:complete len:313 (+) Transcript_27894:183-1121(+)